MRKVLVVGLVVGLVIGSNVPVSAKEAAPKYCSMKVLGKCLQWKSYRWITKSTYKTDDALECASGNDKFLGGGRYVGGSCIAGLKKGYWGR
ncbi:hypothetical protein H6G33_09785 [Calothrix sp. FACHB-1219]|uniref:hypothetical protein n=1 Tax=unclassified Calothrix TaxID=2619626 RepID=UPI00168659D2|nr:MULTISPECIES: hypothetical protein [unclassified Calothrix]MBD2201636.1 hypothetical protein [Calothrix sp. FACHB-168]MBD2217322.1 hypothetical protein [Calothrix sp. FACHB-1219]